MLKKNRIIPVVVLSSEQETIEKLGALLRGGIPVAEITFRNDFAPKAIEIAAKRFPDMLIGAGTVVCLSQAEQAYRLGASFIVSPGFCAEVAHFCRDIGIPYYPGCVTPTEIMEALALGIHTVKFFPANVYGGIKAIKALSAPFPQLRFIPTGGVDLSNLEEYLALDKVEAVGGSFMMNGDIAANCAAIAEILSRLK